MDTDRSERDLMSPSSVINWVEVGEQAPTKPFLFRVGILANRGHCITCLMVQCLLEHGIVPVFVIEGEGTQKLRDKTEWYNSIYAKHRGKIPPMADPLAPHKLTTLRHKDSNINSPECIDFTKKYPVDILVLANARIVKPVVLSVPLTTTTNSRASYLPNHDPAHASSSLGGCIRGAMPFVFAINRNEPIAITLHHAQEELDAGMIVDSTSVDVHRGDKMIDNIKCKVMDATAELWVRAVLRWDGTTNRIEQDTSLLTKENKVAVLGLTGDSLAGAMKSGDEILSKQAYKWYA